jgi:hypothetical protein
MSLVWLKNGQVHSGTFQTQITLDLAPQLSTQLCRWGRLMSAEPRHLDKRSMAVATRHTCCMSCMFPSYKAKDVYVIRPRHTPVYSEATEYSHCDCSIFVTSQHNPESGADIHDPRQDSRLTAVPKCAMHASASVANKWLTLQSTTAVRIHM